jgi:hypothetical protein
MKKYKFKKWVNYLLGTIAFMAFCVMCSECDDLNMFIISHLVSAGIFILTMSLLMVYGDLN